LRLARKTPGILRRLAPLPLAVLVAVVAALVLVRLRERAVAKAVKRAPAPPRLASAVLDAGPALAIPVVPGAPEVPRAPRMLHGDARHTGRAPGIRGPARGVIAWRARVDGAVQGQVVASPDEKTLYVASLGGTLTALAVVDGAKAWSAPLGDRAYGTPCVADDGTIYVGSDAKRFYAVSPAGAILWKLEVDGEADTGAVLTPSHLVVFAAGPHVYAVRTGRTPRPGDGGDVAWRFAARGKVFTGPALEDDGTVIVGSQDHHVYALTPAGALAWSTDLGADVDGAAVITDDGDAVVGTDAGEIVRLHGKTGEVAWRAALGGFVRGTLSLARNGDVLAGVYGPAPRMARVAPDGSVRASYPVPGTGSREMGVHGGALEDARGALFFGAQDDLVRALGTTTDVPGSGEAGWSLPLALGTDAGRFDVNAGDVDAPLTLLASGALVAADDEGDVVLFAP
jgi:outer membrane protein assembly factor BamB